MTPTLLKARVLEAVGHQSGPFTFADIASAMGVEYGRGAPYERHLRRALDALRRTRAVAMSAHGVMVRGDGAASPGVEMTCAIEALMQANGGAVRVGDIVLALDLDDAGQRTLHRMLDTSRYEAGPPLHDGRRWWMLPEAERLALPVPGWRIAADLALENLSVGRPVVFNVGEINCRRRAVGWAAQDARDAANLGIDEVLAAVADDFAADLERCLAPVLASGGDVRVGDFWRAEVQHDGRAAAIRRAWIEFEDGDADIGAPWPGLALSAATWIKLGQVVGADPANMSRGRPSAETP